MRIGLFGIGLDTYWPQFAGLRERLEGYQRTIRERIEAQGIEVADAGLVDSPEAARAAGGLLLRAEVDVIFLYISTYALSSTVLPVVQRAKAPVIVLNLQPVAAIDYARLNAMGDRGLMTGEWLAHCQACCAPEIASVFNRAGIDYQLVTGVLDEAETWREIGEWLAAARVVSGMRENRVGVLGHYYCGMLDVYSDMTQQAAAFGCHFEIVEMCELAELREEADEEAIGAKLLQFAQEFEVAPECSAAELRRAAWTSCALDKLVTAHRLGSLRFLDLGFAFEGREQPADGAWRAGRRGVRNQECAGVEDPRPARLRRIVLGVLCDRFQRRRGPVRSRWPGSSGDRGRADQAGAAAGVSR